jgi:hypothetical protein
MVGGLRHTPPTCGFENGGEGGVLLREGWESLFIAFLIPLPAPLIQWHAGCRIGKSPPLTGYTKKCHRDR